MIQHRPDDYAHRRVNGRLEHAHRLVWDAAHGPVPDGYVIHHECGNKGCVNIDHLRAVTRSEHFRIHGHGAGLLPLLAAKRAQTHCKHGHEFTPGNTIMESHGRKCRSCHNARVAARRARLRNLDLR